MAKLGFAKPQIVERFHLIPRNRTDEEQGGYVGVPNK